MTYYYLVDKALRAAGKTIRKDGFIIANPSAEQYASVGAYPKNEDFTPPVPQEEGYRFVRDGWQLAEGAWTPVFRQVEAAKVSRLNYDMVAEAHLRESRAKRGYTNREPDAYLQSSNPRWKQDALDYVAFRDEVMEYAIQVENALEAGESIPSIAEFKGNLPQVKWTFAEEENK